MFTMRGLSLIVLTVLCSLGNARACGSKLIDMGFGATFAQIHKADHPASILLYMNPSSQLPAADKDIQLQSMLKSAGHSLKPIGDRTELLRTLKAGSFDFVVAALPDADALKSDVAAAPGKPMLVAMLYKPSKEQMTAAKTQFTCPVKAEKNNQLLRVLEEASKSKQKAAAFKCPTA